MEDVKSVATPCDANNKLVKAKDEEERIGQGIYHYYLATGTRPDIIFAVCNVAKFCSDPTKRHWTAVK